jgi:hypothetical protein
MILISGEQTNPHMMLITKNITGKEARKCIGKS